MPASPRRNNLYPGPTIGSVVSNAGLAPAVLVDAAQRENAIQSGIPSTLLEATLTELSLPRPVIAQMLNVNSDQITALRMTTILPKSESRVLLNTLTIFSDAEGIFDSWESGRSWLSTPVPALGGTTPVAKMADEVGRQEVVQVLNKIRTGDFS